jgi:hypothetical protein
LGCLGKRLDVGDVVGVQCCGSRDGMFIAPFEQGEIGPDLFLQACKFGLEGLVSMRLDRRYRAGRSPDWIKVKNRHRRRCTASKTRKLTSSHSWNHGGA